MLTKERIERYYKQGLWSRRQVLDAVAHGCLSAAEAAEILDEKPEEVRV